MNCDFIANSDGDIFAEAVRTALFRLERFKCKIHTIQYSSAAVMSTSTFKIIYSVLIIWEAANES